MPQRNITRAQIWTNLHFSRINVGFTTKSNRNFAMGDRRKDSSASLKETQEKQRVEKLTRALDFSRRHLLTLPKSLIEFSAVQEIELHRNQFTSVPDILLSLPSLTSCNLGHNSISSLPAQLSGWVKMNILKLHYNLFVTIQPNISQLTHIRTLLLNNNQIESIPDEIGALMNLKKLNLSHNRIKVLPNTIRGLIHIKYFLITHNQLTDFPRITGCWSRLKQLKVSGNKFSKDTLPKTLLQFIKSNPKVSIDVLHISLSGTKSTSAHSLQDATTPHSIEGSEPTEILPPKIRTKISAHSSNNEDMFYLQVRKRSVHSRNMRKVRSRSELVSMERGRKPLHSIIPFNNRKVILETDILPESSAANPPIIKTTGNAHTPIQAATLHQLMMLLTFDYDMTPFPCFFLFSSIFFLISFAKKDIKIFQGQFICVYPKLLKDKDLLSHLFDRFIHSTTEIGKSRFVYSRFRAVFEADFFAG